MKFCPTCETRYDEEILRFCTKDGTPLVDENQPNFTEMPSESFEAPDEDFGEETMVRYKPPKDLLEPEPQPDLDRSEAPRIVISTSEQKREQNARTRTIPPYQPPPQKSNTAKVILLTVLGTLAVLAVVLGLFVFLRDDEATANKNVNVNTNPPDLNINTGINLGGLNYNVPTSTNLNANTNVNVNLNTNINANLKTPTPTPTPKPSPSPSEDINSNLNTDNINAAPPPTPKPATPTPNITPGVSPTQPRVTPTQPRSSPTIPGGRPSTNSNDENPR